jgi:hypothetical protein
VSALTRYTEGACGSSKDGYASLVSKKYNLPCPINSNHLAARPSSSDAYEIKAPLPFFKYPISLPVYYLFDLINLLEVHIIDLSIGAIPAGTPPATLILFLSFAAKLISTQTPDHPNQLIEDNHIILRKLYSNNFK